MIIKKVHNDGKVKALVQDISIVHIYVDQKTKKLEEKKLHVFKNFGIVGHEVFACFMNKGGRGQYQPQNAIQSYNR